MVHAEARCIKRDLSRCCRIGVIGDTHGRVRPAILDHVRSCDAVVHTGDVGSTEVLAALAPRTGTVLAVRGNNDTGRGWQGDPEVLAGLPDRLILETRAGGVAAIHGHQCRSAARRHDWLREEFPDCAVVCYGHSHRRIIDDGTSPLVLNPGAAGFARPYGGASMLVLHLDTGIDVEVVRV